MRGCVPRALNLVRCHIGWVCHGSLVIVWRHVGQLHTPVAFAPTMACRHTREHDALGICGAWRAPSHDACVVCCASTWTISAVVVCPTLTGMQSANSVRSSHFVSGNNGQVSTWGAASRRARRRTLSPLTNRTSLLNWLRSSSDPARNLQTLRGPQKSPEAGNCVVGETGSQTALVLISV